MLKDEIKKNKSIKKRTKSIRQTNDLGYKTKITL
jgi:hypothetical protein